MNVYAVSTGSYSDYRVHAIFGSRQDALAHAAQIGGADVETMPFYAKGVRPEMVTVWTASATGPDFETQDERPD